MAPPKRQRIESADVRLGVFVSRAALLRLRLTEVPPRKLPEVGVRRVMLCGRKVRKVLALLICCPLSVTVRRTDATVSSASSGSPIRVSSAGEIHSRLPEASRVALSTIRRPSPSAALPPPAPSLMAAE